ncbi:MAG: hypothetical protein Q8M65_00735, partial [Rhodoglobus sp.]|nr:hypothetical protein [Rhodoglobus sp.]
MNWPPSDFSLAIACGVDGAFVDVTEWLLFDVTYREGRESPFVDTTPGTFAFSLVNEDGRFTPGNTATLATPLVEGMRVCWQLGDRLVTGQIRAFVVSFGDVANAETSRVRITCVDVLGLLARQELVALWDQMVESAGLFARWTFADAVGSNGAVESGPNFLPPLQTVTGAAFAPPTFGASSLPWIDETQALLSVTPSVGVALSSAFNAAPFDYDTDSGGVYGFWLTITDGTPSIRIEILQVGGTRIWIELNG